MSTQASNNKRIAKNTVMLYIRMLLSIVVSLYTSRVVLQTLGVDDYGIYGVVGGVVAMFSFLNASMSGATSRFITFALGKDNPQEVNETFSTALIIHIVIALAIVLLAETIGLWFLEYKLVIPEERMNAARIVYQFSILAMAVQVTQVPYNASIISYEKMDVYAYVELLHVFLKLGIVYLLLIGNFDKLILYAFLVLAVNVIVAFTYRIYCLKHFETCRFHWILKKEKLIPMLSFSGWDLYGNMCYSVRQQGINMLINMFFGVAYNAASSVATSVQGIISNLSSNVVQAFRPQIIKNYAQTNFPALQLLLQRSIKYTLLLFLLIAIPVVLEIDSIMKLWLGEVPAYATDFCRVMLAISMFNLINSVLCIAIEATGNVKRISFISGSIYLISVLITYIIFRLGVGSAIFAYYVSLFIMLTVVVVNMRILKNQIPEIQIWHILKDISKAFFCVLIAVLPVLLIKHKEISFVNTILVFASFFLLLTFLVITIDKPLRLFIKSYFLKMFNK